MDEKPEELVDEAAERLEALLPLVGGIYSLEDAAADCGLAELWDARRPSRIARHISARTPWRARECPRGAPAAAEPPARPPRGGSRDPPGSDGRAPRRRGRGWCRPPPARRPSPPVPPPPAGSPPPAAREGASPGWAPTDRPPRRAS